MEVIGGDEKKPFKVVNWRDRWFRQEDAASKAEEYRCAVKPGYGISSREMRMCKRRRSE